MQKIFLATRLLYLQLAAKNKNYQNGPILDSPKNYFTRINNKYGLTTENIRVSKITKDFDSNPCITSMIIPKNTRIHLSSEYWENPVEFIKYLDNKKFRSEKAYIEFTIKFVNKLDNISLSDFLIKKSYSEYDPNFIYETNKLIFPDYFTDSDYCLTSGVCTNLYRNNKKYTNYYYKTDNTLCTNGIHFFTDIDNTIKYKLSE